MKSLRIAAYILIAIHFLRETRRKLSPESRRSPASIAVTPVRVAIPRMDPALDPVPIATCINWKVASMFVRELQDRGIHSTVSVTDEASPLTTAGICVVIRDMSAIYDIAEGIYSDLDIPPDFRSRVDDATRITRDAFQSDLSAPTASSKKEAGR